MSSFGLCVVVGCLLWVHGDVGGLVGGQAPPFVEAAGSWQVRLGPGTFGSMDRGVLWWCWPAGGWAESLQTGCGATVVLELMLAHW